MKNKKQEININHFIVEFYWMSLLGLKGNELRLYALIYSYSQDSKGGFHGSTDYLAKRLDVSRRQIFRMLNELTEKNLIKKNEYYQNKVKFSAYEAVPNEYTYDKMSDPMTPASLDCDKMSYPGYDKMSPNNKVLDNKEIINDLSDKIDLLDRMDRISELEDKIVFGKHHVLTRYLINSDYLTEKDKRQFFRYDNYFKKFIGEDGYEFEDFKLYVQYFVYKHKERLASKYVDEITIKNKYGYFLTAMEKARWEFSSQKAEKKKQWQEKINQLLQK